MLQRILELPDEVLDRYDLSRRQGGPGLRLRAARRPRDRGMDQLRRQPLQPLRLDRGRVGDDRHARRTCARRPAPPASRRAARREALRRRRQARSTTGETGRIFVGNDLQFEGYTGGGNKDVIDGLMSSGDVGHFDDAGRLFVDGRDDDMIVSGGENVFPQEVEDLLAGHDAIKEAAVFGVDDEKFGQRLKAVVVHARAKKISSDEVKKYVKSNLAGYKVPRDVEFVDELPRTSTGKVLKRELKRTSVNAGLAITGESWPSAPTSSRSAGSGSPPARDGGSSSTSRSTRSSSAASATRASAGGGAGAPRRLAHDRQRLRAAAALRGGARGPVHALPRPGRAALRGRRARGQPARRGDELSSPTSMATTTSTCAPGRATPSRSPLPAQIACTPDCRGLCPRCGANLNDDPGPRPRGRARPALGEARPRSGFE